MIDYQVVSILLALLLAGAHHDDEPHVEVEQGFGIELFEDTGSGPFIGRRRIHNFTGPMGSLNETRMHYYPSLGGVSYL